MVGVEASIDSVFNMVFSSSRSNAACVERNFSRKRDLPLGSDKNEFADRLDTKKKKKKRGLALGSRTWSNCRDLSGTTIFIRERSRPRISRYPRW